MSDYRTEQYLKKDTRLELKVRLLSSFARFQSEILGDKESEKMVYSLDKLADKVRFFQIKNNNADCVNLFVIDAYYNPKYLNMKNGESKVLNIIQNEVEKNNSSFSKLSELYSHFNYDQNNDFHKSIKKLISTAMKDDVPTKILTLMFHAKERLIRERSERHDFPPWIELFDNPKGVGLTNDRSNLNISIHHEISFPLTDKNIDKIDELKSNLENFPNLISDLDNKVKESVEVLDKMKKIALNDILLDKSLTEILNYSHLDDKYMRTSDLLPKEVDEISLSNNKFVTSTGLVPESEYSDRKAYFLIKEFDIAEIYKWAIEFNNRNKLEFPKNPEKETPPSTTRKFKR